MVRHRRTGMSSRVITGSTTTTSESTKPGYGIEWLRISELHFDPRINRTVKPSRVKTIVGEFDSDALGIIFVSKRAEGDYLVVDGQHRILALKEMGWGDQRVQCKVYPNLSLAQEAARTLRLNNTHKWTGVER